LAPASVELAAKDEELNWIIVVVTESEDSTWLISKPANGHNFEPFLSFFRSYDD
jgi:hypothetical protein